MRRRVAVVALIGAALVPQLAPSDNEPTMTVTSMNLEWLTQEWVEIRERSTDELRVLRSVTSDIPPARGRRHLDLRVEGEARAMAPGPTDRLESREGGWSLDDGTLSLNAPGWEGRYRIERLTEEQLELRPIGDDGQESDGEAGSGTPD